MLGLEETHGKKHHIGFDDLFLTRRFHGRAVTVCCRKPLHFFHFHTAYLAILPDEPGRGEGPSTGTAFFVAAGGFLYDGPLRPGSIRVVSYGRLGHNFNLGYADGSLANAGAYTVGPGIAAADDEYPFAAGVDELVFREGISIQNMVLLCQHVEGKVDAFQLPARNGEVAGGGRTGTNGVGIESDGQFLHIDMDSHLEQDSFGLEDFHAAVDDGFVQFEVGDAVTQQSSRHRFAVE